MTPLAFAGVSRTKMSAAVNFVYDGNSLQAGYQLSSTAKRASEVAATLAPIAGSGASMVNVAVSGQTWRMMDGLDGGSAADVDGAWVDGKTNILLAWETTNAVVNAGLSAAQSNASAANYLGNRKAKKPWKLILMTSIPRNGTSGGAAFASQAVRDSINSELVLADNLMRANYRAMGADLLCDLRGPGSPFAFPDFQQSRWDATRAYWAEAQGQEIHITDLGAAYIASLIAQTIRRLPK